MPRLVPAENQEQGKPEVLTGPRLVPVDKVEGADTVASSGPQLVPVEDALRSDILVPKDKVAMDEAIVSGFMRGAQESATASLGTIMESYLPVGRLFSKDKSGDIQFWQSTEDWLGVDEKQWDEMSPEQRRIAISKKSAEDVERYYGGDESGIAYNVARFGGMLVDPTTLIPALGASIKGKMAYGAAIGGSDIAAFEAAQKGKPTVEGVAFGTVLGAGLAGAVGKLASKSEKAAARNTLKNFETNFAHNRIQTDSVELAYKKTLQELGESEESVRSAVEILGVKPKNFTDKAVAEKFLTDKPEKSLMHGGFMSKLIEPISDRINKISRTIGKDVINMERQQMQVAHNTMMKVDPFVRKLEKLQKADANDLWLALSKGDSASIQRAVTKHGLGKDYALLREAMDEMYDLSKKSGRDFGKRADYFPRWVKDYKKLSEHIGKENNEYVREIIKNMEKGKGRQLTEYELADVYNKFLSGTFDPKTAKAYVGSIKPRNVELTPEMLNEAYARPAEAVHSYIREMTEDVFRRQLFGTDVVAKAGDDITTSIGEYVAKHNIPDADVQELKHLLDLRLVSGTQKPHKWIQKFKNYSYSSFLGNPVSAVVQFGDLPLAMAKIGARNAIGGIAESFTKRGLTPKELGLMDNILEEFVSTDKSKKILDFTMKWSGFKSVDSLGKRAILNGGIRRAFKHARPNNPRGLSKLRNRWAVAYGDDYPALERALQDEKGTRAAMEKMVDEINGKAVNITKEERKAVDLVKSIAFAELADIQPTTLSQMPEYYLRLPNGRVGYMLKTFTIKYINLLRREMLDRFASGEIKEGIKRGGMLITAFSAGGISTDLMKDAMLGREPEVDDLIVDNLLKQTGIFDRYTIDKLGSSREPIKDFAFSTFMAPTGAAEPFARTAWNVASGEGFKEKDSRDMVKQIPGLGKVYENWFMGGREEADQKARERSYER
jgi:hypothetical protein